MRASTTELLRSLDEDDWERSGTHTESGPYSVETWLAIYAAHAHDHAAPDQPSAVCRHAGRQPPRHQRRLHQEEVAVFFVECDSHDSGYVLLNADQIVTIRNTAVASSSTGSAGAAIDGTWRSSSPRSTGPVAA